jgi:hypothetical protein
LCSCSSPPWFVDLAPVVNGETCFQFVITFCRKAGYATTRAAGCTIFMHKAYTRCGAHILFKRASAVTVSCCVCYPHVSPEVLCSCTQLRQPICRPSTNHAMHAHSCRVVRQLTATRMRVARRRQAIATWLLIVLVYTCMLLQCNAGELYAQQHLCCDAAVSPWPPSLAQAQDNSRREVSQAHQN